MSSDTTLFGHLALKFASHPENLATEALCYILGRSAAARRALCELSVDSSTDSIEDLSFQTQVSGSDDSIPDIVGFDSARRQVLIVEAKFWAGLTANQPVTYLDRLPNGRLGALVIIAPAARFVTLWSELLRRCNDAHVQTDYPWPARSERLAVSLGAHHRLVLVSWRLVLRSLAQAMMAEHEVKLVEDVEQLGGLCARMDSDAFLPLRSEELAVVTPQRMSQFIHLVDELADTVQAKGMATKKGLKATAKAGQWGHYMMLAGTGVYLHTDLRKWSEMRATPFWLQIHGANWHNRTHERRLLASLETESPSRLIVDTANGGWLQVPLYPPIGVEKDEVLNSLVTQIRGVCDLLCSAEMDEGKAAGAVYADTLSAAISTGDITDGLMAIDTPPFGENNDAGDTEGPLG